MKRLKLSLFTLLSMLLSLTVFAQGDSCVTATVITMSGSYTADGPSSGGNSTNATNSDWYTFTAPSDGKVTVSSCQDPSGTDTRLYFHSGTCAALTEEAANDDLAGCSPLTGFASQISDVPVIGGTTYYIEWDDNWTTAGFDWDFIYTPKPPIDVGVASIESPMVSGCGLSSTTPVTIMVGNYGTDPVSNIDLSFSVDATLVATEILAGPIAVGAFANYTFTATADLSGPGGHTIDVVATQANDGDLSNDQMSVTVTNFSDMTGPIPFTENFDSYATGETVFLDFENLSTTPILWQTNEGATASVDTGPEDDVTGGGNYIFMETSGSNAGDEAVLVSKCIDLTSSINPSLEFYYHMYGASISGLEVSVSVAGVETVLLSLSGQQQTATSDPFTLSTHDLTPFVGNIVQLRFKGTVKDDGQGNNFYGDVALDQIRLLDPQPMDVGISSIDAPSENCSYTNAESIMVTITNFGSTTETGFDVSYDITGPTGNLTATENVGALSLAPETSASYTFMATADMSTFGTYDISVNTNLTGDPLSGNDMVMISLTTTGGTPYPISDNFESYVVGTTTFNLLENDAENDLDWLVNTGPTTSADTGPSQDASGSGNYIYVETSAAVEGDMATICTECVSLVGATNPQLEFFYHLYGGSIGGLTVTIDDGSGQTTLVNYSGQVQTASTDPWAKEIIDLTAYAGSVVSICFSGSVKPDAVGNLFNGDMALDNIIVREPPLCADPYGLQATNVADVSADITWVGSGVPGILEYGPTGFTPGTGTIIDPATSPQNITGLSPETSYDFYITQDCGANGQSVTEGPVTFTTNCSPFPFPGNLISGPIVAPSLPYADSSSTASSCFSDEYSEVSESPDVFYSFTTDPCANSVTVSLCGSDYDTRLSIINPVDTSLLFTNDDLCGLQSEITFPATGGTTYLAVVEGFGVTSVGNYLINITETISTGIDAVALASVDPSCPDEADGLVTAAITGGAAPFNYMWSNGATTASLTGVIEGTYDVTVSDNCGGLNTASVTLTDPAGLLVDAGTTGSICLGESFAIGGVPTATLGNPFPTTLENAFAIDVLNGGFYKHDLEAPDVPTAIDAGLTGDYFAGDFGPDGFYALEATVGALVKIDTASGVPTTVGAATPNYGHTWTGLAWDGTTFHGLSTDGVVSQLYTIDVTTGAATATVAPVEALPIWLAIDNSGNAYTMDIGTDTLYSLDLTTGVSTAIGGVGFDGNFAQDADFDPKKGTLYLAAYNNGNGQGELRTANLATGNTTLIGTYPNGGEIGAFGIADLPATTLEYIYQWTPSAGLDNDTIPNPVATPTTTTTYVVEVSDNCGNSATSEVEVVVKPLPPADAGPDTPLCGMSSVTLTASGGIIYSWSTGDTGASITVSPAVTTTYMVTVTDVNCSVVDEVTVIVSTPIIPTITVNGAVLTSSVASSYQWYFDNMPIQGAISQSYTATTSGIYSVETVDINGCTTQSADEMIVIGSTAQIPGVSAFNAFPNPTSNLLSVTIESDIRTDLTLKLLDIVGRVRHEESMTLNGSINTVLDMEQLPPGIYLLQIKNEDGTMERRVVKQ